MAKLNGLRFLEALEYAKVGNKIRRTAYDEDVFYFYVPKEVALWNGAWEDQIKHDGSLCSCEAGDESPGLAWITPVDILADDWDVVA